MSFILKALKKVEEEKAARSHQPPDINNALFVNDTKPDKEAGRFRKSAIIVFIFIAGSGITYVLINNTSVFSHKTLKTNLPTNTTPLQAVPAQAPMIPTAGVDSSGTQTPAPSENIAKIEIKKAPVITEKTEDAIHEPGTRLPADKVPNARANRFSANPPQGLKVNGIAFQDDPAESVAVINGMLIKRGMSVDGARLEEIFPDKVRFSGKDGMFEVPLTK